MLVSLRLFNPAILMTTPHGRCVSLFWWTMTFKGGEWQQKNYSPTNTRSLTYEAFVNFWSSWETVFRIEVWPAIFICETEAEFNFQSSMLDFDSGAPPEKAWRRKLNSHTGKPSATQGVPLGGTGSGCITRGFREEFRQFQIIHGACEPSPFMANQFSTFISRYGGGKNYASVLSQVGEHGERKGTSLPSFHMGDLASVMQPDTVIGDIVFVLQQKKHPKFKRKRDDIFVVHTLSLTEELCGFQFILTHLYNRSLNLERLSNLINSR
ncbi:hypothetical protein R6Q59_006333 [Mikania micrantha]